MLPLTMLGPVYGGGGGMYSRDGRLDEGRGGSLDYRGGARDTYDTYYDGVSGSGGRDGRNSRPSGRTSDRGSRFVCSFSEDLRLYE